MIQQQHLASQLVGNPERLGGAEPGDAVAPVRVLVRANSLPVALHEAANAAGDDCAPGMLRVAPLTPVEPGVADEPPLSKTRRLLGQLASIEDAGVTISFASSSVSASPNA